MHADGKAALRYEGGFSLYRLNGVKVSKKIAITPADKLDCKLVLTEENAEARAQIVKKIGLERVLKELKGVVINYTTATDLYRKNKIGNYFQQGDVLLKPKIIKGITFAELSSEMLSRLSKIDYSLVRLNIQGNKYLYLSMDNASEHDHKHIEGVGNSCKTVFEAICFRNKANCLPYLLS
ncbi:MAG: hypothetical protein A3K77_00800 [Euryarchaeota archaeon RBG_13_31_8]|nr:MAG: hypothetical protein A3K77_00800 [Euryarchaeota archaeon RBG_13_31_8]